MGRLRVLLRHVLPNIAEPLIVNATIGAGGALLAFAGLSFLGLGVQPPDYDWGRLMKEGLAGIYLNPLAALAPGLAVVIAGLAFNLFGEAIAGPFGVSTRPRAARGRATAQTERSRRALRRSTRTTPTGDPRTTRARRPGSPRLASPARHGPVRPVRGRVLRIGAGEAVGIVGESGSGKSLTALAIAQLIEEPGQRRRRRGCVFSAPTCSTADEPAPGTGACWAPRSPMVFQDPMTSLNPTMRIGTQLAEVARTTRAVLRRPRWTAPSTGSTRSASRDPERRARQYPHEFSGGMRQRAMIGMGLMGSRGSSSPTSRPPRSTSPSSSRCSTC